MDKKPNRLINAKSSYLLQHTYNPVDWHPWGDEAFEEANAEDKPIFLSSGIVFQGRGYRQFNQFEGWCQQPRPNDI